MAMNEGHPHDALDAYEAHPLKQLPPEDAAPEAAAYKRMLAPPSPREAPPDEPLALCEYGYAAWAHVVPPIACRCGFAPASPPPAPPSGEERCTICGKIYGDHFDGPFCDRTHGHEEDEPRQFTPAPPSGDFRAKLAKLEGAKVLLNVAARSGEGIEAAEKAYHAARAAVEEEYNRVAGVARELAGEETAFQDAGGWEQITTLRATVERVEKERDEARRYFETAEHNRATLASQMTDRIERILALEARLGALTERLKLLDRVIGEHHAASVLCEEHDVCPVCTEHGGVQFFVDTSALLHPARAALSSPGGANG